MDHLPHYRVPLRKSGRYPMSYWYLTLITHSLTLTTMSKIVTSALTLEQFKAANHYGKLNLYESKKGNTYAKDSITGKYIGILSEDFKKDQPVMVFNMLDQETSETWVFIANGVPAEPVGEI